MNLDKLYIILKVYASSIDDRLLFFDGKLIRNVFVGPYEIRYIFSPNSVKFFLNSVFFFHLHFSELLFNGQIKVY